MKDTFYLLKTTTEKIDGHDFLCFYVLDYDKASIFRIFKKATEDLCHKSLALEDFDNITENISFVIKRDGKISLDINI